MGRRFGHGDLRLLLLALLERQPSHGYELMRLIEAKFHGQYVPSPGAIYPTLTLLQEIGHACLVDEDGARKQYAVTDEGRAFLEANREAVQVMLARTEHRARLAARRALPPSVAAAMETLKDALLSRGSDWTDAEAARVSNLIDRAARDIAKGTRHE